ncbi:MAG: hypothetical protein MI923_30145 [Phycisphaerales bacterium]|nr:hypothetical protein [Phycisphaerales bacterium]
MGGSLPTNAGKPCGTKPGEHGTTPIRSHKVPSKSTLHPGNRQMPHPIRKAPVRHA